MPLIKGAFTMAWLHAINKCRSVSDAVGCQPCDECGSGGVGGWVAHFLLLFFMVRHLRCLAPRLSAVGEEVFCFDCLPESRDHVSADWFLRLCLINGVEWSVDPELGDCVICKDRMTAMDSIEVLCCSRSPTWFVLLDLSLHVGCITFCNQSLAVFCQVFLFH